MSDEVQRHFHERYGAKPYSLPGEPRFIPPTETPAPGERFELRAVEDWMGNGPIGHMVLVHWVDAACEDHWRPYQDAHDVALGHCRSVGWLVAADAERMVLSANREDGSGDVSSVWVIPAGAVQRVCVFEAVDEPAEDRGPAVHKWIPLEDLNPGLVFMTEDGVMAVKAHGLGDGLTGVICTLLAGSAPPKGQPASVAGGAVVLPEGELVIRLEIESL